MKTNKENKDPKKSHQVETPPPPQVMDPSAPPEKQMDVEKGQRSGKHAPEKKKESKEQKLAPKDEL
jgi:hypothetical protein